jgi:hypothetical protein
VLYDHYHGFRFDTRSHDNPLLCEDGSSILKGACIARVSSPLVKITRLSASRHSFLNLVSEQANTLKENYPTWAIIYLQCAFNVGMDLGVWDVLMLTTPHIEPIGSACPWPNIGCLEVLFYIVHKILKYCYNIGRLQLKPGSETFIVYILKRNPFLQNYRVAMLV